MPICRNMLGSANQTRAFHCNGIIYIVLPVRNEGPKPKHSPINSSWYIHCMLGGTFSLVEPRRAIFRQSVGVLEPPLQMWFRRWTLKTDTNNRPVLHQNYKNCNFSRRVKKNLLVYCCIQGGNSGMRLFWKCGYNLIMWKKMVVNQLCPLLKLDRQHIEFSRIFACSIIRSISIPFGHTFGNNQGKFNYYGQYKLYIDLTVDVTGW